MLVLGRFMLADCLGRWKTTILAPKDEVTPYQPSRFLPPINRRSLFIPYNSKSSNPIDCSGDFAPASPSRSLFPRSSLVSSGRDPIACGIGPVRTRNTLGAPSISRHHLRDVIGSTAHALVQVHQHLPPRPQQSILQSMRRIDRWERVFFPVTGGPSSVDIRVTVLTTRGVKPPNWRVHLSRGSVASITMSLADPTSSPLEGPPREAFRNFQHAENVRLCLRRGCTR